jgi:hypothetical protein
VWTSGQALRNKFSGFFFAGWSRVARPQENSFAQFFLTQHSLLTAMRSLFLPFTHWFAAAHKLTITRHV